MREIKSMTDYQDSIAKKSVLMFTADWCPDCVVIKPALPDIVQSFPEYEFYSVNRDEFMELCQELDIFGIPSFVAFENQKELGRLVNKDRKTQAEIESFIKSL